jgi:hypothetical protein
MEVKELRINNWYKAGLQITGSLECKLDINDVRMFKMTKRHLMHIINFDLEPFIKSIPLTKEILLKCGFEYNNYQDSLSLKVMSRGVINAYSVSDNPRIELGTESGYIFGDSDIKHLHQLQNLYHALTNEELNVEL